MAGRTSGAMGFVSYYASVIFMAVLCFVGLGFFLHYWSSLPMTLTLVAIGVVGGIDSSVFSFVIATMKLMAGILWTVSCLLIIRRIQPPPQPSL